MTPPPAPSGSPPHPATPGPAWAGSLRWRLLLATLVALLLALALAGLMLRSLFRDHVLRQFQQDLTAQLDQVTARLAFTPDAQPTLDARALSDPRWLRPQSGLYWQVDRVEAGGIRSGVLRSRSLWDHTLALAADTLVDGATHVHQAGGPSGTPVLVLERTVSPEDQGPLRWRLVVAADMSRVNQAVAEFDGALAASLLVLLAVLMAAAVAQGRIGLAPLRSLQQALQATRLGQTPRLQGRFPSEVQPLVDEFNTVLDRHAELVLRARTQAGNLAHAIKTPLAVMQQAAASAEAGPAAELAGLVREQVATARRQVDWHLARSRAAAAAGLPGQRVPLAPAVAGLLRVMQRLHAERGLSLQAAPLPPALAFAGEEQDLQEMLGNLLDNACKWARKDVRVEAQAAVGDGPPALLITIDDDGPGVEAERHEAVLRRGIRLDESVPGSGLGLSIVQELSSLYGGGLALSPSALGGLRVSLRLPAAA